MESHPTIQLLSTDIDGTLIGNDKALERFNKNWNAIPNEARPLLCYNTGRLLDDTLGLIEKKSLIEPDYLICGVGTSIYNNRTKKSLQSFSDVLEEGWDLSAIDILMRDIRGIEKQPKRFQNAFKSSWYLNDASPQDILKIEAALDQENILANVVYSSNRDLDVIPKYANKGNALAWLLKHLKITREATLVAGDTGNDSAMFHKRGIRGIVVGNAQPELLESTETLSAYKAQGECADGILEGLLHHGVIDSIKERDLEPQLRQFLRQEDQRSLNGKEAKYVQMGYKKAVEGLRKCITPMGFAACAPEENNSSGTDANYRSVWARDGCITVLGSLSLDAPDIRVCQKATLSTLLDHVSVTGLTPANVSLDTGEPDYSGVGGICSIDSGIWLIIACFEYAQTHKDLAFLRERRPVLQRVMDWLSAHDSNNDGLLEIPEAGDWTDLFGRSYNVLYDEALWYRANNCYGRMLELLGEWKIAGDYLRWATVIKKSILNKFWPSLHARESGAYSFADQQSSIGDSQYLLAQVTPFDFDWRCDVYGNILAYLFDVVDQEHAKKTFQFLIGVGVNQPFPIANLYPPVQAGDPGWRDYYTVNLLNLPNHYHNGGLWPFIGAQWVRYIHKLGLRELAESELIKLTQINEQGINQPWEFNEWCHGVTGKPMGKAIQAWSCSEYIRACHDLKLIDS